MTKQFNGDVDWTNLHEVLRHARELSNSRARDLVVYRCVNTQRYNITFKMNTAVWSNDRVAYRVFVHYKARSK